MEIICLVSLLKSECYFIMFVASVSSQMEERLRYWNGYLLFYERMEEVRTPVSAKKSKVTMWKTPSDKTRQSFNVFEINLIQFHLWYILLHLSLLSGCSGYCIFMSCIDKELALSTVLTVVVNLSVSNIFLVCERFRVALVSRNSFCLYMSEKPI